MPMTTSIEQLKPWNRNPRKIDEKSLEGLKTSIDEFGDLSGIVFNSHLNALVCGHQRLSAIRQKYGDNARLEDDNVVLPTGERFKVRTVDWDETKHAAANIAANNQFTAGEYTEDLAVLLDELKESGEDLCKALNFEDLRIEFKELWATDEESKGSLVDRFIIPPFSVFDTRQAYWQDRKRKWLDLGLTSGEGREQLLTFSQSSQAASVYELRNKMRVALGRDPDWDEVLERANREGLKILNSTSIFDPVLCEVLYSWFNVPGGSIFDPFAGGSVRGIVARRLG